MTLKIIGVTANCGNSTIGIKATAAIVDCFRNTDMLVINCQEVNLAQQIKQLEDAIRGNPNLRLIQSGLMITRTKAEIETVLGRTGMATFVLYDSTKVTANFEPDKAKEIRGQNKNKGGFLNTLKIKENKSEQSYEIRTLTGHLDSKSDSMRIDDWRNIKEGSAFKASNWDELAAKVPTLQIAGYDANTRNIWDKESKTAINLWETEPLSPRIAPMALSPMGLKRYSGPNTYKTKKSGGTLSEDKGRIGYANGGALDYVVLQNNSISITQGENNRGYQTALHILEEEPGTNRDHNVIISHPTSIGPIEEYQRLRQYIYAELVSAAPILAEQIKNLENTVANKALLLKLHRHYLSPEGVLVKKITPSILGSDERVTPYFWLDNLENLDSHILNECAEALKDSFKLKKHFLTYKTKYEAPKGEFSTAYEAYMVGRGDLSSLKEELNKSLDNLLLVTKDEKKIQSVRNFREVLEQFHGFRTLNPDIITSSSEESLASSDEDGTLSFRRKIAGFREPVSLDGVLIEIPPDDEHSPK